jgi:hypothetical protein
MKIFHAIICCYHIYTLIESAYSIPSQTQMHVALQLNERSPDILLYILGEAFECGVALSQHLLARTFLTAPRRVLREGCQVKGR